MLPQPPPLLLRVVRMGRGHPSLNLMRINLSGTHRVLNRMQLQQQHHGVVAAVEEEEEGGYRPIILPTLKIIIIIIIIIRGWGEFLVMPPPTLDFMPSLGMSLLKCLGEEETLGHYLRVCLILGTLHLLLRNSSSRIIIIPISNIMGVMHHHHLHCNMNIRSSRIIIRLVHTLPLQSKRRDPPTSDMGWIPLVVLSVHSVGVPPPPPRVQQTLRLHHQC